VGEFRRPKLLGEVSGIQLTELGSQTGPVLNVNFTKDPALGLEEGGSALLRLWEVRVAHCSRSVQMAKEKNSEYGFVILSMRNLQEFS
jgi:hypothetical protein